MRYYGPRYCVGLLAKILVLTSLSIDIVASSYGIGPHTFALTIHRPGGRLGDQLVAYTKQKWFCWKYGGKLLHVPFPQASLFKLNDLEEHYIPLYHDQLYKKHSVNVTSEAQVEHDALHPSLYRLCFLFHDECMVKDCLTNLEFRDILRSALAFTVPVEAIPLVYDDISVALHVRKGEGYDGTLLSEQLFLSPPYTCADENFFLGFPFIAEAEYPHIDQTWPLRFPPDQFYLDQLITLAQTVPHKKIHVYLFTDALDPKGLADYYAEKLAYYSNITISTPSVGEHKPINRHAVAGMVIDYRNDNQYNTQLLSELWCMAQCDILIRPSSGVSLIAEIIGDHHMVITPVKYYWDKKKLVMDMLSIRGKDRELVENYKVKLTHSKKEFEV